MATKAINTITATELRQKQEQGKSIDLIDVRTPAEFEEVHAVGARNVPLDRLDPAQVAATCQTESGEPIYVICRSGSRAAKACEAFLAAGIENIVNVEGGTQAWDEAGHPVRRGRKTISLERQVRIVAGSIVLVGALLAFFVNIHFVWLSAFVGAGLAFAGITDTCGMAMVLAKMPWNQVRRTDAGGAGCETLQSGGNCCG